uniref:Centromere protein H C-terminal domain-containing protein n=1 Tax=Coccidioides posadasii RMSCC 3488 TaxID=454284 RepID=A0A0J6FIG3_COCPO|nr:hypothetical protein CPAG_09280 [Coccidioides posadasii RMSCC 3488]
MAPGKAELNGSQSLLKPNERALVELASDIPGDDPPLREKELEILSLYDRIYDQQLEEALFLQDPVDVSLVEDVDAELVKAERELLEARAAYSVRRKAIESVLMTEPSVQSIYSAHASPTERVLLPLINRRDVLSLVYENLAGVNNSCVENLSNAEVSNIRAVKDNRDLVRSLLEVTDGNAEEEEIKDLKSKEELETLKRENKNRRDEYMTMKRIVSAVIVASGLDWASDEKLLTLVVEDESADEL